MEMGYLSEFVVLAECGSFLEAAERLFIAQSSLSKHIKAMETELGVPLFQRTTRKVELSEFGRIFLDYARQISDLQGQYGKALADQLMRTQAHLRVGSLSMMTQYGITDVLVGFKEAAPTVELEVTEGERDQLKDLLRSGHCDLAFLRADDKEDPEFEKVLYVEDRVSVVLPQRHHLAVAPYIFIDQLRDENFLMLPESTMVHDFCLHLCKKAGFEPNIIMTLRKGESLIDLVGKGMGIALLMRKPTLFQENPNVAIVDIHPISPMNVYLFYPRKRRLSPFAQRFVDYVRTK